MSFIIDVFENLLKYNDKNVFILLDINNEIWFKLKDIYSILGYSNTRKSTYTSCVDSQNKVKYRNLKVYPSRGTPLNNQPNAYFVNEAGMYQLLTNSRKPIANDFKNELFTNILPSIRKSGVYKVKEDVNDKINKLNKKLVNKINNIEDENNYYKDKHTYKPTYNSYIYIIKKDIGSKKCYKIGYTDDIEKRIQVYRTAHNIKIIYYIPIIFDGKQTEECVKNINKLHKLKQKTDDLCYLSLKQLKNSISNCLYMLKLHVCNCVLCKKKIKINNLDKHECNI